VRRGERGALVQIGPYAIDRAQWDWRAVEENPFWCPDAAMALYWADYLDGARVYWYNHEPNRRIFWVSVKSSRAVLKYC